MLIDTHCHLNYSPLFEKHKIIIQHAEDAGVKQIICVGTDLASSFKAIDLAETYKNVFATVGIHPHDATSVQSNWQKDLIELSRHPKVRAIGEIGLDFYRNFTSRETQLSLFSEQIEIAKHLGFPIVIHNRRSDKDIKRVLTEKSYFNGVLHCFSSDANFATEMLELGLHISFTGNATYGNKKTEAAIRTVPFDRLMLETDAPFLAPFPHKGRTNEPAFIPTIALKIAEIKECSLKLIEEKTTETAQKFFCLT